MNSILNKKIERLSFAFKMLRVMRLSILFLFISMTLTLATNTYSQSAVLNLNMENATIEEVIGTIEQQTEYHFLYNKKVVNVEHKVSISANAKHITEVLNTLFKNTDISYTISDRHIVLNRKGASAITQQTKTITGQVVDTHGEPIIGVNIVEKGTTIWNSYRY